MEPIKVDFGGKGSGSKKDAIIIPPEKSGLKIILSVIGSIIFAAIAYYVMLPPINLKAQEFYYFIGAVIASFVGLLYLFSRALTKPEYVPYVKKTSTIPFVLLGIIVVTVLVGLLISSTVLRAKRYSELMPVTESNKFAQEIPAPDFNSLPKLDEDSAAVLANRSLSDLSELGLVSQFSVYPTYNQINYQGNPIRVATLKYANIIKWFTNRSEGLPGYIIIDMANEKTNFHAFTDGNMKYSPTEHFGRLLKRQLRFDYPTYMFADPTFEIDDAGNPFWVCGRIDKTIGLFGGRDIIGIVLMNAIDGTSEYFTIEQVKTDKKLQWIDRVYSSSLLVEQYDYYGRLNGGFWNSVLGQKKCFVSSEGSNYLAKDDDVFLYTGVTSLTSDESITGFVLINQRTKATTFYSVAGAKEVSAMGTAEGIVADLKYKSTFPLLINVGNEATYFMSLKDDGNVVQKYALINVQDYNKIKAVGSTIAECLQNYTNVLKANNMSTDSIVIPDDKKPDEGEKPAETEKTVTGKIADIRTAVIGGNSMYYIKLEGKQLYYSISASASQGVVIFDVGMTIKITYEDAANAAILKASKAELAVVTQ